MWVLIDVNDMSTPPGNCSVEETNLMGLADGRICTHSSHVPGAVTGVWTDSRPSYSAHSAEGSRIEVEVRHEDGTRITGQFPKKDQALKFLKNDWFEEPNEERDTIS